MRVTVRLFARLRELAGRSEWMCELQSPSTVADVWRTLTTAYPDVAAFAPAVSCAVNADFAQMTTAVREGDEVAFLPPVSGGARQTP
ncbi:MAG: molybdopterin converting factor subunit 1 [Acidobacteriota bacterium]